MARGLLSVALAGVLVVGLCGCASIMGEDAKDEKPMTIADVPAPARATIEKLTAGGTIEKLDMEKDNGKVIYDVEAMVEGLHVEYDVAADGSVISAEKAVAFASLPEVVKFSATKFFGSAEGLTAMREEAEGKVFYEVSGKKTTGKEREIKLNEAGEIIEKD